MKTQNYLVKWTHINEQNPEDHSNKNVTICTIISKENEAAIARGSARLGKKDTFNKKRGNAVSLLRVLKGMENKAARTEIYVALKEQSPKIFNELKQLNKKTIH